jgi:RNA ligase (TIGR02306 family)
MSTFKVEICQISTVEPHPNADRLDIIRMVNMDWNCVTQRGAFKPGDAIVYIPIDSILTNALEAKIFGPDSKVKLHNSRVRTIKLRGAISQGLAVAPHELGLTRWQLGDNVAAELGITKYEPPVSSGPLISGQSTRKQTNPNFRKYTGIENAKNYSNVFNTDEVVVVTEKLHGINARYAYVPYFADTFIKKVKKFLGLTPRWEFVYGSHNVQLQSNTFNKQNGANVYLEMVDKYKLNELLMPGEALYGEIIGPDIQKGYHYGCKSGERKLVVFDVIKDGEWLSHEKLVAWCYRKNLKMVPTLYVGPYDANYIKTLTEGPSVLEPSQAVIEGVVVRPKEEQQSFIGRKILKYISETYLLDKNNTEHH